MTTLLRAVVQASGLSRRKAFAAIRDGRVSVDAVAAAASAAPVPAADPSAPHAGGLLRLDGEALAPGAPPRVYLLLNKPPGFITTVADERRRPTAVDLLPPALRPLPALDQEPRRPQASGAAHARRRRRRRNRPAARARGLPHSRRAARGRDPCPRRRRGRPPRRRDRALTPVRPRSRMGRSFKGGRKWPATPTRSSSSTAAGSRAAP